MTEIEDNYFYDIYEFSKSVYLFSHMKTNLVDDKVQKVERTAIILVLIISIVAFFFVLFKTLIIIGYFLCMQATTAFIKFIQMLFKNKFNINFKSSCKNSLLFFGRVCKKLYTFNFYIFYSKIISGFMIFSFWICLLSNFLFNIFNIELITEPNKSTFFFVFFFISFECNLLIEFICCTFYAHPNMCTSTSLAFGYYIVVNIIMALVFLYARRMEELYGAYLLEEPQRILNVIIFSILFVLKVNCLIKISQFNKRSKCYFYNFI